MREAEVIDYSHRDWVMMWFTIGFAHWLSIKKSMPPKWAAIALGFDFSERTADEQRDLDYFYSRLK